MAQLGVACARRPHAAGFRADRARRARSRSGDRAPRRWRRDVSSLTLWRLSPAYHAPKAMSGDGAYRRGGRWNPPGIRVIYCAESRSLAVIEVLANIKQPSILGDQAWVLIPIEVALDLVEKPPRVPESW